MTEDEQRVMDIIRNVAMVAFSLAILAPAMAACWWIFFGQERP